MDKQERYDLYSVTVCPGWWDILDKYIPQILAIAPDAELYIKEKYGLLRLNARSKTVSWKEFGTFEREAKFDSAMVCEICGAPGRLRENNGWRETLCDRCNDADQDTKEKIIKKTAERWLANEETSLKMKYFRATKIDGSGFFSDKYTGDLFNVEYTQNEGESWLRMSTHLSFEGADQKMRSHVALHPEECALWENRQQQILDVTGAERMYSHEEVMRMFAEDPSEICDNE